MTINMKSTKQVIFDALKKAQEELSVLKGNKYDPVLVEAEEKKGSTLLNASRYIGEDIESQLLSTEKSVISGIRAISAQVNDSLGRYHEIEQAIQIMEDKLKTLTGIEATLLDVVSVANAKEELVAEYDNKIQEMRNTIGLERTNWNLELQDLKAAHNAKLAEQESDWKYDFDRKKKRAEEELQDELRAERKDFDTQLLTITTALDRRESELTDRERKVAAVAESQEELQKQVDSISYKVEYAEKRGYEKAKEEFDTTLAREIQYLQRDFDSQKARLEDKVALLEKSHANKDMTIADLTKKLDDAYQRIQEVAVKASTKYITGADISK